MQLKTLVAALSPRQIIGALDRVVESIAYDSRRVQRNGLFVALRGEKSDGHRFIDHATEKGPTVIVTEREVQAPRASCVWGENSGSEVADLGATFCRQSARRLNLDDEADGRDQPRRSVRGEARGSARQKNPDHYLRRGSSRGFSGVELPCGIRRDVVSARRARQKLPGACAAHRPIQRRKLDGGARCGEQHGNKFTRRDSQSRAIAAGPRPIGSSSSQAPVPGLRRLRAYARRVAECSQNRARTFAA